MADTKHASYNLHDYVKNNNNSFDQQVFNDVDGVVLTQVSNMNFDGVGIDINSGKSLSISDLYEKVKNTSQYNNMGADDKELLKEMANSSRYKDMLVSNYVHDPVKNDVEGFISVGEGSHSEQFAAATISYEQNGKTINYMSFRATDGSDDGWNEDFSMISSERTQAQLDSVVYMNIVGRNLKGDFSGGGHSKGGNNFEYSYLFCDEEVRKKFISGYMYDSPGLQDKLINGNPNYDDLQRISKGHFICPQDSIVGQLLHENDNAVFVYSVESGFNEHDPYSWEINPETSEFIFTQQSEKSKYINKLLDNAVADMDDRERSALYALVSYIIYNDDENAEGLSSFIKYFVDNEGNIKFEKISELYSYIKKLPKEQREKLIASVGAIITALVVTSFDYGKTKIEVWFDDVKKRVKKAIDSAVEKIKNWAKLKIDEISNFFNGIYTSIISGLNKFKEWVFKNSIGYKYASVNTYIQVDTSKMQNYASQLSVLSARSKSLDSRMNSLYLHAGFDWNTVRSLSNISALLKAGIVLDFAGRLDKCASYLKETASDFEKVEKEIAGRC